MRASLTIETLRRCDGRTLCVSHINHSQARGINLEHDVPKKWHVDLCLQAEVGAISSCQLADSGQLEPVKRLSNPAVGTVGMAVVFLGKTPVLLVCLNYLRIKTGVLKVETALRESNDTRSISVML